MTRHKAKGEMEAIGYMIEQRLKARALVESAAASPETHLDEDTIGAFVEGRLGEPDSAPIVSHLVLCHSCRSTTAQLIRLASQTGDELEPVISSKDSSNRLHSFFESLAARFTPSAEEDVVFAYQSPEGVSEEEVEKENPAPTNELETDE